MVSRPQPAKAPAPMSRATTSAVRRADISVSFLSALAGELQRFGVRGLPLRDVRRSGVGGEVLEERVRLRQRCFGRTEAGIGVDQREADLGSEDAVREALR